jgi:peptidoglycan/xylan/chitin deacetylase (PgdA/CDA1 family)
MFSSLSTGISVGLGATAGLGLAAGGYIYATVWPSSQLFGRTLIAPARPGELALTFDDGPNPAFTPQLLDILARHGVHATFFMVGRYAQAQPALVRRIIAEGHQIGNHSWSHINLAFASASSINNQLSRTSETLEQISGAPVRYFRPPFGARRPEVLRAARRLGLVPVLWDAMTSDWVNPSADEIAQRLMRKIDSVTHGGRAATIVLHDGSHAEPAANRAPSVAATAQLLARYQPTHEFVSLDAWAPQART